MGEAGSEWYFTKARVCNRGWSPTGPRLSNSPRHEFPLVSLCIPLSVLFSTLFWVRSRYLNLRDFRWSLQRIPHSLHSRSRPALHDLWSSKSHASLVRILGEVISNLFSQAPVLQWRAWFGPAFFQNNLRSPPSYYYYLKGHLVIFHYRFLIPYLIAMVLTSVVSIDGNSTKTSFFPSRSPKQSQSWQRAPYSASI